MRAAVARTADARPLSERLWHLAGTSATRIDVDLVLTAGRGTQHRPIPSEETQ
ncbi:MAG: hypothetical protein WDA60_15360 [Acidimicrobiia bacterium]